KNRVRIHQTLGFASIVITVGVLISGFYVSLGLVERAIAVNSSGARPLLLVNLLDMLMFSVLYYLGLANRTNINKHKRFMTLAVIILLNPGFFRIGRFIIGGGFVAVLLAIVITSGVILLYAWLDKKQHQKVHPVIKRAAIVMILVQIIRIPLAITPQWAMVADWMLETF
ncbi:MAG: hypothetical protein AAF840_02185, partial [Bacteroidota bacterium]